MHDLRTLHYAWYIALGCLAVACVRAGIGYQTMGFIINPAGEELGWSKTEITGVITFREVVAGLSAPFVGRWIDLWGPRYLIVGGAILVGLSLTLISFTSEFWQFGLFFGVIGGVGVACLSNAVVFPLVAKWFVAQRGRATGIVSSGANIGGMLLSPIIIWLMTISDWRTTWFVLGFVPVVVLVPIALFVMRRQPEDIGLEPLGIDHASARQKQEAPKDSLAAEITIRQAIRMPAFWLLMIGWNLTDFALKGALLHKIPAAETLGFSTAQAGGLIVTYGAFAILGKIGTGFLVERMPLRLAIGALTLMQACGLVLFINADNAFSLHLGYGTLSGFSAGGLIMMMPFLLASLFGRRNQGAIMGVVTPIVMVAGVGGPMLAAILFDLTGTYQLAFVIYAAVTVAGGLALIGAITSSSRTAQETPTSA